MLLTRFAATILPAGIFALLLSSSALAQSTSDLERIAKTEPSQRSEQRLKLGGVVDKVLVKPGDRVKADQLLMRQDTTVEQAEAHMYRVLFEASEIEIKAARTKNEQAKNEFARWDELYKKDHAASINEWEKSRLEVELTGLEIQKSQCEKQKNEAQLKRAEAVLKAMELRAKFDGIVEKIDAKEGEVIDYQRPAITIVNNTPLWIEWAPMSEKSKNLKVDQTLSVQYLDENKPRTATIIFISPVVSADSDRQLVRLKMENPDGKPAGLRIRVEMPGNVVQQMGTKVQ